MNKRLALLGRFEDATPPRDLDPEDVGLFNILTIMFAQRFVYSSGPDFVVTVGPGRLGGKEDLLTAPPPARKEADGG